MLSDPRARDLLHQAADTIEVAPAGPIAVPPHRPWWPVVAAAAAALVIGGLAIGLRGDGDAPIEPAPPAPADLPDRVPSVFGYDAFDARRMLEAVGYDVTVETVPSCDIYGRAVGTRPGPGRHVTLLRGNGSDTAFCATVPDDPARADAWELLDLVGGRDSELDLAPTIAAYEGETPTSVRGDELATWAPLADYVARHSRPLTGPEDGTTVEPYLSTRRTTHPVCDVPPPASVEGLPGLVVAIETPADGTGLGCEAVVLFRDAGRVVAVQVVKTRRS